MIPKSFSATSLQLAQGCLSRYKASVIDRAADEQGDAANVGIVLHGTLEEYVRSVFIRKDAEWDLEFFRAIFDNEYYKIFGADRDIPQYVDAHTLAMRWFNNPAHRERLESVKILSLESKNSFRIPAIVGENTPQARKEEFTVNYIMDRVEQIGPKEYRVVDYKTNWVPLNYDQLRAKIQARLYALALQIVYKDAETVWVEFDFLRFEPIGVVFTKADNADTWRMLKRAVQRVISTSDEDAAKAETINGECGWCVKKATCKALQSNVAVGGIHSLDANGAAELYAKIKAQTKALKILEENLQDYLLKELISAKTTELDLANARIRLKRSSERELDHEAVAAALGPEITSELGRFTLTSIDALLKSGRLTTEQRLAVERAITKKFGAPKADVILKQ